MALLPSGYVVATTGNSLYPSEKIGGVAIGITSATTVTRGNPITKTFLITDNAMDGTPVRRSVPVQVSGVAHAFSTTKAYQAGTFAYNQSDWMVRGLATTVNGVANTSIRINGNESTRFRRNIATQSKGAQTSTAWKLGYFRYMGVSKQRSPWSTAPSTNDVSYVTPTGSGVTVADDQAIYVTYRTVPGELVYLYGALDVKMVDYSAITG